MKKSLIALAVLAAAGSASAQSTVTLSGLLGFAYQSVDVAAVPPRADRGLTNTDATINVAAVEDLGGGLKAAANIGFDTTGSTFGSNLLRRNTSLSVSGGFGSVTILNTRSGNLLTKGMVAPSNLPENMYNTSGVVARVAVDGVQYMTPKMSGFNGYVQWVEAVADGNTTPTVGVAVLGANYASGPLAAGFAYKMYNFPEPSATIIRKNRLEAFATYNFGVATVGFGYDGANVGTVVANAINDANAMSLGVSIPVGALTLGANWAKRDVNTVTELVAKYDLSKRTALNASLGKRTAVRDAALLIDPLTNIDGSQYRVGIAHAF